MLTSALDLQPEVKPRSKVNIRSRLLQLQQAQQNNEVKVNNIGLEVNNNETSNNKVKAVSPVALQVGASPIINGVTPISPMDVTPVTSGLGVNSKDVESHFTPVVSQLTPGEGNSPESVGSSGESGDSPEPPKDIGIWSDDEESKVTRISVRRKKGNRRGDSGKFKSESAKFKNDSGKFKDESAKFKSDSAKFEGDSKDDSAKNPLVAKFQGDLGKIEDASEKSSIKLDEKSKVASAEIVNESEHTENVVNEPPPTKPTMISTLTPAVTPATGGQFRVSDPGRVIEDQVDEELQLHDGIPHKKTFVFNIKLPKPEVTGNPLSKKKKHKKKSKKKNKETEKTSTSVETLPTVSTTVITSGVSPSNPVQAAGNPQTAIPGASPSYPTMGNTPHQNMMYNAHYYHTMQMHQHYMRGIPYPYYPHPMMGYMAYPNRPPLPINGRPPLPSDPPPLPEEASKPPEPVFDSKRLSDHAVLSLFASKDITDESLQRQFDQDKDDVKLPSPASSRSATPHRTRKRHRRRKSRGRHSSSSDYTSRSRSTSRHRHRNRRRHSYSSSSSNR
ncbi:uncharacterized protein LOC144743858 [Ciona intestinalis]